LAYALMWSSGTNEVTGFEIFVVIFAFIVGDLGSYAQSGRARSRAD
jgi:hypothetical protein